MNTLYHDIVIDLNHMGFPESVTVKQYDDQIPHVRVELRQNGAKYVIPSGTTLRMQGTKPDGTHFMYDVIRTDDGRVDCPLTNQTLAAAGPILTEVCMTDTTGELTTFNFYILAQKAALSREEIESSDDYESIDKIREETQKYKEQAEAAKTAAEAAKEAATKSANTATQQAQTAQLEAQKVKQIVAGNEAYTKTESDLKYTVAPRKEASSDTGELKLTDADEGLSYLELQGNSEQYSNTANKNLIDLNFATDGYSISSTGTLDKNEQYFTTGYIVVEPGEQYTFTRAISISNRQGCFYDKDKIFLQPWTGDAGLSKNTVTVPENAKYLRLFDYISHKEASQLEKGNTATDYVPGAVDTPSPEYPSEVRSVGDIPKDINGVEIRNLLNEEWIKSQPESAWTKDSSGTVFSIEVALPKTRLYIRTPDFNATDAEGTTFGISKRPGSLAAVDGIYFYKTTLGSFDFSGQEHIYIILGRQDKNWDLAKKSLMKSRLMVTSAAEIDEYRPYIGENNGLIKLESSGINRADAGDGPILMGNGNNIEVNTWTPRKIVLTQKNKSTSWAYVELNLERGKTYTFYCKAKVEVIEGTQTDGITKVGFRQYPPGGVMYGQTMLSQDGQYKDIYNTTGVIPDDVPNMAFMIYLSSTSASNGNVKMTIDDLMVVEGTKNLQEMKALKYQPYHQQITWIPLREPLRGLTGANLKLYADKADKNGYVTQNIYLKQGKDMATFDTDAIGINTSSSPYKYAYWQVQVVTELPYWSTISVLCNMLKRGNYNVNQTAIANTAVVIFNLPNTLTGLADAETDKAAITAAIKAWVNTNNPMVYYALKNPIEYQIPMVYIETYDQETNVRCLNKVKPSDMTLDYKIAMSSLIKRLEALEEKTVQEV